MHEDQDRTGHHGPGPGRGRLGAGAIAGMGDCGGPTVARCQAWAQAWRALDAGPLADLLARAARSQDVVLTLCGERHAEHLAMRPRSLWQRLGSHWKAPRPAHFLETL